MNLLWLPHAPWHVPQRAGFFVHELAKRHDVWVADWDADFSGWRDLATRRYLLNLVPRRWQDGNVHVQHVPRFAPALFSATLRRANDGLYRSAIDRIVDEAAIDVVIGSFVAPVPEGVATVADVFDDNVGLWREQGRAPAYADEIRRREGAWIERSRVTVAVSSVLAERVGAEHPGTRVEHVSNGVDTARFRPDRAAARRDLGLSTGVRYVGNVGRLSHRHEAERLLAVAARLQDVGDAELVVVGDGAEMAWLERRVAERRLDRVRFAGFQSGDTLLRWFQALDVGLCPYARTPANDARVPMRLLHYSAVGATVVSTDLEEVARMGFANVVRVPPDPAAFAEGTLEALDRPGFVPEQVEGYDVRRVAARYEAVLAGAVDDGERA